MLKRILASIAITSLVLAATLLVYWWRSKHGYVDGFTLGSVGSTQSHFISRNGRVILETTDHLGTSVVTRLDFYEFKNVFGFCLIVPALWVAIKVRSLLPRPPGLRRNALRKI